MKPFKTRCTEKKGVHPLSPCPYKTESVSKHSSLHSKKRSATNLLQLLQTDLRHMKKKILTSVAVDKQGLLDSHGTSEFISDKSLECRNMENKNCLLLVDGKEINNENLSDIVKFVESHSNCTAPHNTCRCDSLEELNSCNNTCLFKNYHHEDRNLERMLGGSRTSADAIGILKGSKQKQTKNQIIYPSLFAVKKDKQLNNSQCVDENNILPKKKSCLSTAGKLNRSQQNSNANTSQQIQFTPSLSRQRNSNRIKPILKRYNKNKPSILSIKNCVSRMSQTYEMDFNQNNDNEYLLANGIVINSNKEYTTDTLRKPENENEKNINCNIQRISPNTTIEYIKPVIVYSQDDIRSSHLNLNTIPKKSQAFKDLNTLYTNMEQTPPIGNKNKYNKFDSNATYLWISPNEAKQNKDIDLSDQNQNNKSEFRIISQTFDRTCGSYERILWPSPKCVKQNSNHKITVQPDLKEKYNGSKIQNYENIPPTNNIEIDYTCEIESHNPSTAQPSIHSSVNEKYNLNRKQTVSSERFKTITGTNSQLNAIKPQISSISSNANHYACKNRIDESSAIGKNIFSEINDDENGTTFNKALEPQERILWPSPKRRRISCVNNCDQYDTDADPNVGIAKTPFKEHCSTSKTSYTISNRELHTNPSLYKAYPTASRQKANFGKKKLITKESYTCKEHNNLSDDDLEQLTTQPYIGLCHIYVPKKTYKDASISCDDKNITKLNDDEDDERFNSGSMKQLSLNIIEDTRSNSSMTQKNNSNKIKQTVQTDNNNLSQIETLFTNERVFPNTDSVVLNDYIALNGNFVKIYSDKVTQTSTNGGNANKYSNKALQTSSTNLNEQFCELRKYMVDSTSQTTNEIDKQNRCRTFGLLLKASTESFLQPTWQDFYRSSSSNILQLKRASNFLKENWIKGMNYKKSDNQIQFLSNGDNTQFRMLGNFKTEYLCTDKTMNELQMTNSEILSWPVLYSNNNEGMKNFPMETTANNHNPPQLTNLFNNKQNLQDQFNNQLISKSIDNILRGYKNPTESLIGKKSNHLKSREASDTSRAVRFSKNIVHDETSNIKSGNKRKISAVGRNQRVIPVDFKTNPIVITLASSSIKNPTNAEQELLNQTQEYSLDVEEQAYNMSDQTLLSPPQPFVNEYENFVTHFEPVREPSNIFSVPQNTYSESTDKLMASYENDTIIKNIIQRKNEIELSATENEFNADENELNVAENVFNTDENEVMADENELNADENELNLAENEFNADENAFMADENELNADGNKLNVAQIKFLVDQNELNATENAFFLTENKYDNCQMFDIKQNDENNVMVTENKQLENNLNTETVFFNKEVIPIDSKKSDYTFLNINENYNNGYNNLMYNAPNYNSTEGIQHELPSFEYKTETNNLNEFKQNENQQFLDTKPIKCDQQLPEIHKISSLKFSSNSTNNFEKLMQEIKITDEMQQSRPPVVDSSNINELATNNINLNEPNTTMTIQSLNHENKSSNINLKEQKSLMRNETPHNIINENPTVERKPVIRFSKSESVLQSNTSFSHLLHNTSQAQHRKICLHCQKQAQAEILIRNELKYTEETTYNSFSNQEQAHRPLYSVDFDAKQPMKRKSSLLKPIQKFSRSIISSLSKNL